MQRRSFALSGLLACLLGPSLPASPQNTQKTPLRTLSIVGHAGQMDVFEAAGHSYIELQALAELTGGTLGFKGSQIILTLPPLTANPPSVAAPVPAAPALSKEFLNASIEEMGAIREWRSAMANAIQNGFAVTENWVGGYRSRATDSLRLASVAATTGPDHDALKLLNSEFANMQTLSDRYLAANKSLTYTPPNALDSDPLFQKVLDCAHSLATITSSGTVTDAPSCH